MTHSFIAMKLRQAYFESSKKNHLDIVTIGRSRIGSHCGGYDLRSGLLRIFWLPITGDLYSNSS